MKLSKKSLLSQKYTEEFVYFCCRTPQGVRGLKFINGAGFSSKGRSHPARGAWIEITIIMIGLFCLIVAPRKGCVD